MKQKLTPWFPPEIKPVHIGVYQRKGLNGEVYFNRWNGRFWLQGWNVKCGNSFIEANKSQSQSFLPDRKWRGLAEQPK